MIRYVGIGEYIVSDNEADILKTFALASCVAVTFYCPVKKVLGMAHVALPESEKGIDKSIDSTLNKPGFYADYAIPLMYERIVNDFGCKKCNIRVKIYGGAKSINSEDVFNVGQRNIKWIESFLEAKNMACDSTDTGGHVSRTLEMDVATGTAKLSIQPITI